MELGNRLETVLSLVRSGAVIYDIGSDHGYLPCELIKRGICPRGVVTDVNRGPLDRGMLTFSENGISHLAQFHLTDGLMGLQFGEEPSDVTICGMGGELISAILQARSDLFGGDVRFILQPMTKSEHLRRYLWESGFHIEREVAASEGDKRYIIIKCVYSGKKETFEPFEAYLGKAESVEKSAALDDLYSRIIAGFEKKLCGMNKSGADVSELEALVGVLKGEAQLRRFEI